jgi:HAD superfamily hydrolase (TIGR01549 family)
MSLKYRTVLFDLDDTLFDHQRHRRDALRALGQAAGFPHGFDVLALERAQDRHSAHTEQLLLAGRLSPEQALLERMRGTLLEFGISAGDERMLQLEDIYRTAFFEREWTTVPSAIQLLDALRRAGARIVLITNGGTQAQYLKLDRLGLRRWLDDVVVSEEVGCEKPSREYFEIALARARCGPSECVVVGDLWHTDIIGAHRMGIDAIWLNRYAHARGKEARAVEITGFVPLEKTLRLFHRDSSV